ncbi:MAG: hypothetical protein RMZ69_26090 [Nostoc sp. ChiQUE01a]|nr:hypothetical protein [Nostoc sp. ChiQUE01a]
MTVSQQISPSALRAYKLSKYANGQPSKMLLEAKKLKRVTSQFMSKNGAKEAGKRMKALKKTASTTKTVADNLKKVQDLFLKKIPGTGDTDKATKASGLVALLAVIGVTALLKLSEFVQEKTFENLDALSNDLTKTNQLTVKVGLQVKETDKKIVAINQELSRNAQEYNRLNKQTEKIAQDITAAKKQANDSLYEVRQGRTILESKIAEAKKQANDSLYEVRQGRTILESKIAEQKFSFDAKIQQINSQIAKFSSGVSENFQNTVNSTIGKIQSELASVKATVAAIKPAQPVNTDSITANAVSAARALVTPLQSQVGGLQTAVGALTGQTSAATTLAGTAINGVSNLASAVATANNTAATALAKATTAEATANTAIKEAETTRNYVDRVLVPRIEVERKYVQETIVPLVQSTITKTTGVEAEVDVLQQQVQQIPTLDNRIAKEALRVDRLSGELGLNQQRITQIEIGLKEQEKVNSAALPKLDQILDKLPFIPGLTAAAIKPDIPTLPQIENATGTAMCKSMNGGCSGRKLDNVASNINQNTNNKISNALDAVNTGANAALLAGQQTILQRLGNQLPGGLSGTFGRLWQTLQVDRILNILILITTFHNAAMLSTNIVQTLFSGIDNLGQAAGFKWKNEEGNEVGFGGIASEWSTNFFESIFGATTLQNINTTWNAANRTYQSVTNALWNIQGMFDSVRSIGELAVSYTGKIGNALKRGGALFEDAFPDMTEVVTARTAQQAKWDAALQNVQPIENVVSAFSQVTGEIVSIGDNFNELKNQRDEFFASKAAGEDAVTQLITGEKAAAQVNQPINNSDVQKTD